MPPDSGWPLDGKGSNERTEPKDFLWCFATLLLLGPSRSAYSLSREINRLLSYWLLA